MFHPFHKLPPELRHMIWTYAVEEPRVIRARALFDDAALDRHPKFSPIHDACHEARRVFLESRGLALPEAPTAFCLGVAWHPGRDYVMYQMLAGPTTASRVGEGEGEGGETGWDAANIDKAVSTWRKSLPGRGSVRNIICDREDFNAGCCLHTSPLIFCPHAASMARVVLFAQFPRVQTMRLIDGGLSPTESRQPRTWLWDIQRISTGWIVYESLIEGLGGLELELS
ncbi:hypothetical protein PG991_015026 [Apiospora marii]|uniref:2EXR domain-containing protein n=1 Tax=Apiospora marii TaxID=335849 RepID=A0ABR1R324_9PEZI